MGIAVVKVTREVLNDSLTLLSCVGSLISVHFPTFYADPCEVRLASGDVPDGEHEAVAEVTRQQNGLSASMTVILKIRETT